MDPKTRISRELEWIANELRVTSRPWIDRQCEAIITAYSSPGRHYHDLEHIAYVLDLIMVHNNLAEELVPLVYAALRHDEKYLAYPRPEGLPSNEALSMAIADEALVELNTYHLVRSPVSFEFRRLVAGNIEVTLHDQIKRPAKTQDEMLMADIDWSPMGQPWREYLQNRYKVRQEYAHYTDEEFAAGRAAWLSTIRGLRGHFYLPEFQEKYGEQARENVARDLELTKRPVAEQIEIMRAACV